VSLGPEDLLYSAMVNVNISNRPTVDALVNTPQVSGEMLIESYRQYFSPPKDGAHSTSSAGVRKIVEQNDYPRSVLSQLRSIALSAHQNALLDAQDEYGLRAIGGLQQARQHSELAEFLHGQMNKPEPPVIKASDEIVQKMERLSAESSDPAKEAERLEELGALLQKLGNLYNGGESTSST
jgi:hypothetical protein